MNNAGGKAAANIHRYCATEYRRAQTLLQATFASLFFSYSRLSRPSNSATMSSTRRPHVPDVPEPVYEGEKWSAEPSAKKGKGNETWAKNIAKKQRHSGQEYGRRYNAHAHNRKNRYFGTKLIIQESGRIGDSIGIQYLQI